jgi:hypothetical protein
MTVPKPKDPYTGIINDALSVLIPLVAAPSTKKRNLVHFFVPAENTSVDFGAGAIPGIRMVTDNHVHLTARTPLTTLSLGLAAGPNVTGPDGINFMTDGNKTESVKLKTWETYTQDAVLTYSAKKNEEVTGAWDEKGHNTKTETVTGLWQQTAQTDRTEVVIGTHKETYGQYQRVVLGQVTQTHMSGKTETVVGPMTQTVVGATTNSYLDNHFTFKYGARADVFCGLQAVAIVGAQLTSNTGVQATTNVGATMTVNAGPSLTVNSPVTLTKNTINMTVNSIDMNQTDMSIHNKPIDVEIPGLKIIK